MKKTNEQNDKVGWLEWLGAVAVVAAVMAFGLYRVRFGLSFSDEGFSLSTPLRYALGDLPFRDEVLNPLRWFDILMVPVITRLPEEGAVLALRHIALAFHFACVGALVYSLRKHLRPLSAALLFAVGTYSNVLTYWTPTYHSVSFDFICLAAAFMIIGCRASSLASLAWGAVSGVAFSLAWACELPAAALLAVPAFAAVVVPLAGRKRNESSQGTSLNITVSNTSLQLSPVAVCCVTAVAVSGFLLAGAFWAIRSHGLLPDLRAALDTQLTLGQYDGGGVVGKLFLLLKDMGKTIPWMVAHAVCWGMVAALASSRKTLSRIVQVLLLAAFYFALPVWMVSRLRYLTLTDFLEGGCLLMFIIVPYTLVRRAQGWRPGERIACLILFSVGVVWNLVLAYVAANGLFTAVFLSFPFLLASLILCADKINPQGREDALPGIQREVGVLCACMLAVFVSAHMFCIQDGAWIWKLDGEFGKGKLRGIRLFSEHVESTDALLEYLKPRVRKGETLLSFYENPMVNYLTDTRQALCTGLPSRNWPESVRAGFVENMVRRGRVPRYVVNLGGVADEPIYGFVQRYYIPVARFDPYIVWQIKPTVVLRK